MTASVQISFRQIRGTQNRHESETLQDTGDIDVSRIALLSQEGNSLGSSGTIILYAESILDSSGL